MAARNSQATNVQRLAAFLLIAAFAHGSLSFAQRRASVQELEPFESESAIMTLLQQMTRAAGIIFAGEVISVRRPAGYAGSGQDAAEGIVTVEFRVDEAVRGSVGGSIYTLREWAGLWTGGERYRTGQRLLIFLRGSNANGLSSPVHGMAGAIPLRGDGVAPGRYDRSALAAGWMVDLRWVQAQAMRGPIAIKGPVGFPLPKRPISDHEPLAARDSPVRDSRVTELVPVGNVSSHWTALPPAGERSMQPLAQVLSLCRSWARSSDGSR